MEKQIKQESNKPPDAETLLRTLIDLYLEQEGIEAEYEIVDANDERRPA